VAKKSEAAASGVDDLAFTFAGLTELAIHPTGAVATLTGTHGVFGGIRLWLHDSIRSCLKRQGCKYLSTFELRLFALLLRLLGGRRLLDAVAFIARVSVHLVAKLQGLVHRVAGKHRLRIRMFFILRRDLDHDELLFWALADRLLGVGGRVTSHVFQFSGAPCLA
jgi:hypothetical protein